MKYFLTSLGWILAMLPEFVVRGICKCVGTLIWGFPSGRNRVALSNISHCFPEINRVQIDKIARESACRMVEMALFVLASPHMSDARLKKKIKISDFIKEELGRRDEKSPSVILMIPHFCMMETITMFPMVVGKKIPRTGVFYRPFDSKGLEDWIKSSRSRCGLDLISRKKGLSAALEYLKNKGVIAVLFDQNAGGSGVKSLFFGRICSTSELAGLFVERTQSVCGIFFAKRTGFWSSYVDGEYLNFSDREEVTIAANNWLEKKLREDETARFDWLWLHRRWYVNRDPRSCLNILGGKSILEKNLNFNGLDKFPRAERIFIVAPSEKLRAQSLIKQIPTLRKSRPDAAVTLICEAPFAEDFKRDGISDCVLEIPSGSVFARLNFFRKLRARYPDILINFRTGFAADFQARLVGAQMLLGARLKGEKKHIFAELEYVEKDVPPQGDSYAENALKFFGMRG